MPTRYYCDRCDNEIEAETSYFLTELRETNSGPSYNRPSTYYVAVGGRMVDQPIAVSMNMICKRCAEHIARVIRGEPIPKGPNND